MSVDVSILISIISVVAAVFFSYQLFKRNNASDNAERASMDTRMMVKLDGISDDIKEIQRDNKDLRKEVSHINERVIVLEQQMRIHPEV